MSIGQDSESEIGRDPLTYSIIGAAMSVHQELGQGFLESVYQEALQIEFVNRGIPFLREVKLPIYYRGHLLESFFQADFVCFSDVIIELKAIKIITENEQAQVINYLKATGFSLGLLINFGEKSLSFRRLINKFKNKTELIYNPLKF